MKNYTLFFSLFFSIQLFAQTEIETKLFELPDVIFTPMKSTPEGYEAAYKVKIKQPLDHNDISKGHFYQKIYLLHKDISAPTVMITQGYNRNGTRVSEVAKVVKGNQLDIEHRFYGESLPDSMMYEYLTLEQATSDLHRINQVFKNIYENKWISTGISKGGQTTIYYRYFFPDDVDVSIPYVAPLNLALEETRIYDFLDNIGTKECRKKIEDVQFKILENREESFTKLKWYSKGAKLDYSYLTFEEAMEYAVLEYPFSFWQWGGVCDEIPTKDQPLDEVLQHFLDVSGISFFSDKDMEAYASHYYQAGTQMGYYSYESKNFKDLLKALPSDSNPSAVFMPNKMDYTFDDSLPKAAYEWVTNNGDEFIYINGANDTWSATAVPVNKKRDALWFNLEGKDHGQARMKNMTKDERKIMINKLESWLGLDLEDPFMEDDK